MMRRPWILVLDATRLIAYAPQRGGAFSVVTEATWNGDVPARTVDALKALTEHPSGLVLVIGLAWLDAARPELPPVSISLKRRMLTIDADRWFAFSDAPAIGVVDEVALAMPSGRLEQWRMAFEQLAPVLGITTVPHAAKLRGLAGDVAVSAGMSEHGLLRLDRGVVREVRRSRQPLATSGPPLDGAQVAAAVFTATRGGDGMPADLQLVSVLMEERLAAARRTRWWRAGVVAATSLLFVLWAAGTYRARVLEALTQDAARLATASQPALEARLRLERARDEHRLLSTAPSTDPGEVLALLGELLPADVVVQRAEWDGLQWRIDGSAADAAALIPRLDGHPRLADVRALAPSTRYLDGGRQRSSFSIGLRLEAAP